MDVRHRYQFVKCRGLHLPGTDGERLSAIVGRGREVAGVVVTGQTTVAPGRQRITVRSRTAQTGPLRIADNRNTLCTYSRSAVADTSGGSTRTLLLSGSAPDVVNDIALPNAARFQWPVDPLIAYYDVWLYESGALGVPTDETLILRRRIPPDGTGYIWCDTPTLEDEAGYMLKVAAVLPSGQIAYSIVYGRFLVAAPAPEAGTLSYDGDGTLTCSEDA